MTRQDLIDFCLTFPGAYEDYPYDKISQPGSVTVMRHSANKKSFATIYERKGRLCEACTAAWDGVRGSAPAKQADGV
ncbi:MAG: hypothetical protein FWC27_07070 [Firmicutes bacterium]|nr:hypothetical protein [Bacillota bacterium]